MVAVIRNEDIGDVINRLVRDVANLQQMVTSPSVMGGLQDNVFEDGIVIGPPGNQYPILPTAPNAVTNITAIPGTFFNDIYVDVTWDAATTGEFADAFEVELATRTGGGSRTVIDVQRTGGENMHITGLLPDSLYSVRVTPVSRIGLRGPQSGWVDFATAHDAGVPPAPSNVVISRGATSAIVMFTALTAAQAPDVANGNGLYEIEIDTSAAFNTANKKTARTTSTVFPFSDLSSEGIYFARVSAIDASGNQSAWSATSSGSTVGGVIDSMILAGLSAAKITVGEMHGDRIQANTINVAKLMADSVLTKNLAIGSGGQFTIGAAPSGTGMLINSQGIRLYQGTTPTIILDALTGTGTFTGQVNATGGTFSGTITGGTFSGGTYKTTSDLMTMDSNGLTIRASSSYSAARAVRWVHPTTFTELARMYSASSSVGNLYIEALGSSGLVNLKAWSSNIYGSGGELYLSTGPSGTSFYEPADFGDLTYVGDWWRVRYGTGLVYNENYALGISADFGAVRTYGGGSGTRLFAQCYWGIGWDHMAIRSEAFGSQDQGYAIHHPGVRACRISLGTNSVLYFRGTSGESLTCAGTFVNESLDRFKLDVDDYRPQNMRDKMKRLRPVKYKPKPNEEELDHLRSNTLEELRGMENIGLWQREQFDRAAAVNALAGLPMPEPEYKWSPEAVENIERMLAREHVGWVAEDIVQEFPEMGAYDDQGNLIGMFYDRLTVPLLLQSLEQDDEIVEHRGRIEAAEQRAATAENRLAELQAKIDANAAEIADLKRRNPNT